MKEKRRTGLLEIMEYHNREAVEKINRERSRKD